MSAQSDAVNTAVNLPAVSSDSEVVLAIEAAPTVNVGGSTQLLAGLAVVFQLEANGQCN